MTLTNKSITLEKLKKLWNSSGSHETILELKFNSSEEQSCLGIDVKLVSRLFSKVYKQILHKC